MAGGVVMSPSPIIEVVMSPSPIIGVVEHPAMAGGVISPIITGVVEHPAMAVDMVGGIISLSPIIGVEDQKSSLQMQIQIQILALLSLSTVGGAMSPIIGVGEHPKMAGGVVMSQSPIIGVVMSPSPIIGVVEHQKHPRVVNRVKELERKGKEKERTEAHRKMQAKGLLTVVNSGLEIGPCFGK